MLVVVLAAAAASLFFNEFNDFQVTLTLYFTLRKIETKGGGGKKKNQTCLNSVARKPLATIDFVSCVFCCRDRNEIKGGREKNSVGQNDEIFESLVAGKPQIAMVPRLMFTADIRK